MVQVFRCRICGEAFVANNKGTHCPFCGAPVLNVVDAKDYVEPKIPKLSAVSRKNLEFSFGLEIRAAQIYQCMRKKSRDEFIVGMFKILAKVELEHAELIGKLINKPVGCEIPFKPALCTDDRKQALEKTRQLETDAVGFYKKFLEQAAELRVKEIFKALVAAEQDHLELAKKN